MDTGAIVSVTDKRELNLPLEIQSQLQPGDEYRAIVTENSIVLKKVSKLTVDLDEFLQDLEELEPDPNQLTPQEISDLVKEVRRELWSK